MQTDTQQVRNSTRTESDDEMGFNDIVGLAANVIWLAGFILIGIGILDAYSNPAEIQYNTNGNLIIQGVIFRNFIAGIFLMGLRTIYQMLMGLVKFARRSTSRTR